MRTHYRIGGLTVRSDLGLPALPIAAAARADVTVTLDRCGPPGGAGGDHGLGADGDTDRGRGELGGLGGVQRGVLKEWADCPCMRRHLRSATGR
jgi:hypothetical protein